MRFSTKIVHIGEEPNLREGGSGDVVIPIHLSSTFARAEIEKPTGGYEYSRSGNPTRAALEKRLAALEGAKYGLAFASGLAAETVLILSLLKHGDEIIASDDLYGGTKRLFQKVFADFGIKVNYLNMGDPEKLRKSVGKRTKLVWVESPTNPLMKLADITAIVKIARKKKIMTVVDNTFMSPYLQQPLKLGADIVIHSTTKYINGHSDSIGGAVMTSNEKAYLKLKFNQNATGAILSPFDSYMILRGIKTLAIRMEKHQENARTVAIFLDAHKKVKKVYYPGLDSHPQYELAKRQMKGPGAMFSFEIKGGLMESKRFLSSLKVFSLAESLGGVESLIEHPALMTHSSIPRVDREKIGISDSLIRISVGIEDVYDLIDDLDQALVNI